MTDCDRIQNMVYRSIGMRIQQAREELGLTQEEMAIELERNRIEIMVAEVHQPVREMARRSGLAKHLDRVKVFPTVDAAVHDFLNRNPAAGV